MEKVYSGRRLDQISYPMGGIGAGMVCLEGTGRIASVSLHNRPNIYNEPNIFAAVTVKGENKVSRVLEGPVTIPKIYGGPVRGYLGAGCGMPWKNYGLPRFRGCEFSARFPFAHVSLWDEAVPLAVKIEGYSPFIPCNADDSSLPSASVSYTFSNDTNEDLEAVFYFSADNFMKQKGGEQSAFVRPLANGFMLEQQTFEAQPFMAGAFTATTDSKAFINTDFYRSGWWDGLTMRWKTIAEGTVSDKSAEDMQSPGGALEIPFTVKAHGTHTITVRLCWYVPDSNLCVGKLLEGEERTCYRPWYAKKFASVLEVTDYFATHYDELYKITKLFSDTLYASQLPHEFMDAVTSNLTILKSTTVLRQEDGRFWGWEGCQDDWGSCHGSCTHVWNYAQALCHLFPSLERTLREVEFEEDMNENGQQQFRTYIPIRRNHDTFYAASDGQPGGIMKMYREWRISGDNDWIAAHWDKMITSLEYCIRTWDKRLEGVFREPHHNTYDIEFWGADGMCTSFYLGALKAIAEIGKALGKDIARYETLYQKGREYMETVLFNGEYFMQIPEWETLEAEFDPNNDPVLEKEGPKYQYGNGCLSDGVCGAWLAKECGLGDILDPEKIKSHLLSVYKYNFRKDLSDHANPQRPGFAVGNEGGLLVCSWPNGGRPSLPFVYSDEVFTGIEYQVAAHLTSFGYMDEALDIVTALRARYDGEKRNPYGEYECGHWYARAMASYALLHEYTGVRYDAVTKTLYTGKADCKVFLSTATGFGLVTRENGIVKLQVVHGVIDVERIETV